VNVQKHLTDAHAWPSHEVRVMAGRVLIITLAVVLG